MTSPASRTAHDAPALARFAALMVWGSLVVTGVSSLLYAFWAEALGMGGGPGFGLLLLALSLPMLFFPYWRYVTWLRAVAVGRATDADRVRVQRWAAALQWLTLVWLVYVIGSWLLDQLGLWRGDPALSEQNAGLLAFQVISGVVTVGLLVQLRRWVDVHTHTQADAAARVSQLSPLLPGLTPWVRAAQGTVVVGLLLALSDSEFAGTLPRALDVLTRLLITLLEVLALELSLRFVRASAGTPLPQIAAA